MLETFLERHKVEEDQICVSYPGQKTLARFVKLPPAEEKKVPEMVKYEARQQIPFDLESVTWGYEISATGPEVGDGLREHEVGILALRTYEAEQFLYPFHELLKADLLQADSVALYNCLQFDRLDDPTANGKLPSQEVIAILDFGTETSNLVIGNRECLWLRNIPIGSNHFNRTMISELKVTHAQAEQLKRNPLKYPLVHKVYKALHTQVVYLVGELRRSLSYYEFTYRQRSIKQLYITGGGAKLHGLIRLLRSELT
jgi:type IV pilus assembly protein PilM